MEKKMSSACKIGGYAYVKGNFYNQGQYEDKQKEPDLTPEEEKDFEPAFGDLPDCEPGTPEPPAGDDGPGM